MEYFNKTKMTSLLVVMASLFITTKLHAQCPTGNVSLNTQAHVNEFGANYPNCKQITGELFIGVNSGTTDITNLSPLSKINSVTGNLFINNTQKLTSLAGLNNIKSVGGYLRIEKNAFLNNLNGFSSLVSIGKEFYLHYNPALINLNGLSSLTNVSGFLYIANNDSLTNLIGLQNLTNILLDIDIEENAILNDISALQNTTFHSNGGYGLTIINNPALSVCNLPNFCSYLANPASTHPRSISGNLANCVNEAAVVLACMNVAVNDIDRSNISVYPNPIKSIINFSEEVSNIKITDISGRMLKKYSDYTKSVNVENLIDGIYIIEATTNSGKLLTRKFVKSIQ